MKTFFIIYKKMNKEIITFADIEIEKLKFFHCINLILLKDVDIDNILIFSIISSSEKKVINTLSVTKMMMIIKLNH